MAINYNKGGFYLKLKLIYSHLHIVGDSFRLPVFIEEIAFVHHQKRYAIELKFSCRISFYNVTSQHGNQFLDVIIHERCEKITSSYPWIFICSANRLFKSFEVFCCKSLRCMRKRKV